MKINESLDIILECIYDYEDYIASKTRCGCWHPFCSFYTRDQRYYNRAEQRIIEDIKLTLDQLRVAEEVVKGVVPRLLMDILQVPYQNPMMIQNKLVENQIEMIFATIDPYLSNELLSCEFKGCLSKARAKITTMKTVHIHLDAIPK